MSGLVDADRVRSTAHTAKPRCAGHHWPDRRSFYVSIDMHGASHVFTLPRLPLPRRHQYDARTGSRGRRMAEQLTDLIGLAQGGDRAAADRLFTVVYAELRAIAGRQRQRVEGAPIGATSLERSGETPSSNPSNAWIW